MQISQILHELERQDAERMAAIGNLPIGGSDDLRRQMIIAQLKKKTPQRALRQQLAADPNMRPILKMLRFSTATEE